MIDGQSIAAAVVWAIVGKGCIIGMGCIVGHPADLCNSRSLSARASPPCRPTQAVEHCAGTLAAILPRQNGSSA